MIKSRENAEKPVFPAYKVQLEKFKKYRFFRRKSAVPAIFRKFRLQKSVLWTIEPFLMVGIVINNVFVWKNNEI